MKIVGIIAEYNPFHNGHAYQINKIRELTGADYIIIAMSGDFVQRGAPAILDKYARAKMALSCGADLVIELPVLWAASSAENFAMAGVTLFDKMGCVDGLCFGAETDDLSILTTIADILAEEPESYQNALSSYLKSGLNFPAARAKALLDCCTESTVGGDSLTDILNAPNNILALEYLKALKRRDSKITPILLKREGTGYHDTRIADAFVRADSSVAADSADVTAPNSISGICTADIADSAVYASGICASGICASGACASATAIRNSLLQTKSLSGLTRTMPAAAFEILSEYCQNAPLLTQDDFSAQLHYRLLLEAQHGLDHFYDSNPDISNRILKNRNQFLSFSQFCEYNKSRDITYTRMSRILLHILLGLTNDDFIFGKNLDFIAYLRPLGFRKASAPLFSIIKQRASVPMVSKLSDAENLLDDSAMRLLRQDIFAAELYEQVLAAKRTIPRSEYTREIVRID